MSRVPSGYGLRLALEADGDGAHPAAWRFTGRPPSAALGTAALRATAEYAEAAGFALLTFADSPLPAGTGRNAAGRIEAGVRAAYLSTLTDRIGLAPTLHATTTEPFHLATQLASLDHACLGRAGWVVGATNDTAELATIGGPAPLGPDRLRGEVSDVIEVARCLWDSWQDDAIIRDRVTGRFLDPDRVHHVNFTGGSFSVVGPLITPRPPQGQVVVIAADTLGVTGQVDVALVGGADLGQVANRARRAREDDVPLVFAEVEVLLDAAEPAAARLAALAEASPWAASDRLRHVGSAERLTALLRQLATVVDGVRLHPAVLPVDLPVLAERVLPALAADRSVVAPIAGATLRATLGLPHPANRFAGTTG
ncbi:LLM class flavin-dependent oxidoreductase [Micromonospora sp. NBC_01699]|uniref:LLM class flavin-dependent oxidoreductase n=1 Tax=Micromonospora sp. NBC_01699 TaxID=2975984 RepID=UPI002E31C31E|nr:LLM class flavin-dependent oxidoreductase [Micromonospora sp. NBC_01699]